MNWTKPYCGVSHLDGPNKTHATVEQHRTFATWGCYSWLSHRWFAQGEFVGSKAVERAKEAAARRLRNA